MFDAIKCAVRNLGRKKMRSGLTILGIAIGVASVVTIGNISECGSSAVGNELDSLGLGGLTISADTQAVPAAALASEELEAVQSSQYVEQAMPVVVQNTEVYSRNSQLDALVWGVDGKANQVISLQVIYGRTISNADVRANSNVCMVDETFARNAYSRENIVGKKISILCGGTVEEFEVVGVVKTGSGLLQNLIGDYIPNFVYMPYTTMQAATGKRSFDQIAVRTVDGCDTDVAGEDILQALHRATGLSEGFAANNLVKQKDGLTNLLNIVTLVLSAVGAISLLVASLSIMTVMLVSVNERTREIGIKKSIGARRGDIMFEFLMEAMVLSLIGCIAGLLVGSIVSFAGAGYFHISLSFRWDIAIVACAFSVLTGMIFGVYPAAKASNMRPVDALRLE